MEILSDENIQEQTKALMVLSGHRRLARESQKDTLRQVIRWGTELCYDRDGGHDLVGGLRRNCAECWDELEKLAEE